MTTLKKVDSLGVRDSRAHPVREYARDAEGEQRGTHRMAQRPYLVTTVHRAALVAAAFGLAFAACGGKAIDGGSGGGSSGGSSTSSGSSGGSGGSSGPAVGAFGSSSSGSSSAGGGLGSSSGVGFGSSSAGSSGSTTPSCITLNPSAYNQSCNVDADCILVRLGTICTGQCICGGETINRSEQARYDAAISGIMPVSCPCPPPLPPQCLGNKCVVCTGGPADPPECGAPEHVDAGLVCMETNAHGSGGGDAGSCGVGATETCSDGTTYTFKCSCPAATCYCLESSAHGGGSGGPVPFAGCWDNCARRSLLLAYQACGFPLPQH
jgi:hypothetical protein